MPSLHAKRGRTVGLVTLFIAIGFALNIAVAWACAVWSEAMTPPAWMSTTQSGDLAWPDFVPSTWPTLPSTVGVRETVGRTTNYANSVTETSDTAGKVFMTCVRIDSGWPLRSFSSTWYRLGGGTDTIRFRIINSRDVVFRRGLPLGPPAPPTLGPNGVVRIHEPTFLPLNPIPLGVVLNTMLYGSVAYVLVWMLTQAKARRRRARGLCEKCAYDTRGLTRCPECGTETTAPSAPPRS